MRLKGDNILIEAPCKGKKVSKLVTTKGISEFYQLTLALTQGNGKEMNAEVPVVVREVLQQYKEVFQEPKELPPARVIDHIIPLESNGQLINVRPYKYPHFQKTEMERLVMEM